MTDDSQKKDLLKPGERLDDLQRKGYQIIQNPDQFCFGIDAVLLSDFIHIRQGEQVLDLGTGTGIIPILLEAKTKGAHFVGLEVQEEVSDMARRSVLYNGQQEKIDIVTGDIKEAAELFPTASFDVITINPPYMGNEQGLNNSEKSKTIARHEILCTLDDILRESAKLLPERKGRFYMIHKPFRLTEVLTKMQAYQIEPKRIQFVHPYVDKEPTMFMVEGVTGGRPQIKVEPPIVINERAR